MTETATNHCQPAAPAKTIPLTVWVCFGLGSFPFMVHCVFHTCTDGHLAHEYWPGYGVDLFWITCWGATMMIVGWRHCPRAWLFYTAVCAAGLLSFLLEFLGAFLVILPLAVLLSINKSSKSDGAAADSVEKIAGW